MDLNNIPAAIWTAIAALIASPVFSVVAVAIINRRKTSAETESVVLENMTKLIETYADTKEQDEKIKAELRSELKERKAELVAIREKQDEYVSNSTKILQLYTNVTEEVKKIRSEHEACMKEHERTKKTMEEIQKKQEA